MLKYFYLALAIIGGLVPPLIGVSYFGSSFTVVGMIEDLYATPITAAFITDFLISWIVLVIFIMSHKWKKIYTAVLAGHLILGMSFAFPFFLYLKLRTLDSESLEELVDNNE